MGRVPYAFVVRQAARTSRPSWWVCFPMASFLHSFGFFCGCYLLPRQPLLPLLAEAVRVRLTKSHYPARVALSGQQRPPGRWPTVIALHKTTRRRRHRRHVRLEPAQIEYANRNPRTSGMHEHADPEGRMSPYRGRSPGRGGRVIHASCLSGSRGIFSDVLNH